MRLHIEVFGGFGLLSPWGEADEETCGEMVIAASDLVRNASVSTVVVDLQRVEGPSRARALEALDRQTRIDGVSLRVVFGDGDVPLKPPAGVRSYDTVPEAVEWTYERDGA